MISKEQARMLEVFQKHGAQATHVITDMGFGGIQLLVLTGMDAIERQADGRWMITDTGRLALEEFEGAQEAPSKGTGIKLSNPQQLEGLKACFADWYDEDALHKIGLSDYDIGILTLNGLIAWNRHHNGYEITEMGAIVKAEQEAPVVSDAAKIAALEAENAALRGLLAKALDAIAPIEMSCFDADIIMSKPDDPLWISFNGNIDNDVVAIRFSLMDDDKEDVLRVSHLRNAASIALRIRDMIDPSQPYENTPDGSDLLARDTEADDDE